MRFVLILILVCTSYAQKSDFEDIDFKTADSLAMVNKDKDLSNLPDLAYGLTYKLETDVEKFRAIYMWVCANVANDYNLFLKTRRKKRRFRNDSVKLKSWNKELKHTVFENLRNQNRTICTGYAYLVKALAELVDLDCEIVHGYGRTSTTDIEELDMPNHSWNVVKLNDKWYLCDATWASGIPDPTTFRFKFEYNDGFFLASPELFSINHFPLDQKWLLTDSQKTSYDSFLESPIIYGKAYQTLKDIIKPKSLNNVISKEDAVNFRYILEEAIEEDNISLLIDNGRDNKMVKPNALVIEDNILSFNHQFKFKGIYDVHLIINDDLISSYTFKVKS